MPRLWEMLTGVRAFVVALVWLMILVSLGTVAQGSMPMEEAMALYFRPAIVWLGVVPVPGVPVVLGYLCVGLLVQLARTRLRRGTVGSWLAHMGVLMLVASGLAATVLMQSGYVVAPEGQPTRLWQEEGQRVDVPPSAWPAIGLLPFQIRVDKFEHRYHPGTTIPAHFASLVSIIPDNGVPWKAVISMNEPVRYMGYTMYQSSFLLPEQDVPVSILAVVHDRTRLLPYLATAVLALGILLQVVARRWVAVVLLPALLSFNVWAGGLEEVPVQHQGRVKPLAAVAEVAVPFVVGHKLTDKQAMDTLAMWLLVPSSATQTMLVIKPGKIPPGIGLEARPDNAYTLADVVRALLPMQANVEALRKADPASLSSAQVNLLALTERVETLLSIARTLAMLQPIQPLSAPMAKALGVEDGPTSAADVYAKRALLAQLAARKGPLQVEALALAAALREVRPEEPNGLLRFVPPAQVGGDWLSPWLATQQMDKLLPHQRQTLDAWEQMMADPTDVAVAALALPVAPYASPLKLKLEMVWLHYPPISLAMIPLAVAVVLLGWRPRFAMPMALLGWGLLGAGLLVRMMILGRPPVATLYESVLFVAWGTLGLALLFRRASPALLPAGVALALGLAGISHGLTQGQDTMGMLTAVLDTNFWLGTHVLAITGGYAASLMVGGMGIWAMVQRVMRVPVAQRRKALRLLRMLGLWAMLLTATGTLLGGVWASQSWGRFWGWDPKENGALVLTLWLVAIAHLRLMKPCPVRLMLACAAATPVVVALSWFGVNLLGVGLHSYGFTTGLANGLALFCALAGSAVVGLAVFDRVKPHEE